MHHSLWVPAIVGLAYGTLSVVRPDTVFRLCSWQKAKNRIQTRGIILLVVGLFLIVACHYTRLGPLVMTFGFLLALTGIVDLMAPSMEERVIDLWMQVPPVVVRLYGVVMVVIGVLFGVAALSPGRWP